MKHLRLALQDELNFGIEVEVDILRRLALAQ